jgi:hypothetical protein
VRGGSHRHCRGKGETEEVLHDGEGKLCLCDRSLVLARTQLQWRIRGIGDAWRGSEEQGSGRWKTTHDQGGARGSCSVRRRHATRGTTKGGARRRQGRERGGDGGCRAARQGNGAWGWGPAVGPLRAD